MSSAATPLINAPGLEWLETGYGSTLSDDNVLPNEVDQNSVTKVPCCCDPTTRKTIGWFTLNALVFGGSSFYGIYEWVVGSRSITVLTFCAAVNGATWPVFVRIALNSDNWERFNRISNRLAYPAVYTFSQVQLNLNYPPNQSGFYNLPFIASMGHLAMKNLIAIFSAKLSDLPFSTQSPEVQILLPTLDFTTRDRSCTAISWSVFWSTTAIGAAIANFFLRTKYDSLGDLGKIGFYQDMIAMLVVGNVLGDKIARLFDNHKETLEMEHASRRVSERKLSGRLTALRLIKNGFYSFNPLLIGSLLAIPASPNSDSAFICKAIVGALLGAQTLIDHREFEKQNSPVHSNYHLSNPNSNEGETTCAKTTRIAKKAFADYGFLSAFSIYSAALIALILLDGTLSATAHERLTAAVSAACASTWISFLLTHTLATRYKPAENSNMHSSSLLQNLQEGDSMASMPMQLARRVLNELKWRLEHSPTSLATIPQYLLITLNIGDVSLKADSNELYGLSLVAWSFWGLAVGNDIALAIRKRSIVISSPLASIVLAKVFVENLQMKSP